jgi:hypothetical protein
LLRKSLTVTAVTLLSLAGATLPVTAASADSASADVAAGSAFGGSALRGSAPLAGPTPAPPKKLFTIDDERVDESSGLAKSAQHDGIWWTVNDSGDTARVFAVDGTGEVKAELGLKADVTDVEAVAVDADGTIYIADIGDNKATRDMIEVYTIPEPADLEDQASVKFHRYDFEYPDGAHDAETLLIQPSTKRLYFVTKSSSKAAFYAAPETASREGTNELTKVGAAPAGVTDGTFMPDGKSVVLRTYLEVLNVAWARTPTVVAKSTVIGKQSESIAVGPTGKDVIVGSEGPNSAVYQVQVPAKTTGASSSAAPTPGATAAGAGTEPKKNHNLRWIVVGAALLAIIITFVTFPAGRRERLDRMAENARLTGQPPPNPHGRRRSNA